MADEDYEEFVALRLKALRGDLTQQAAAKVGVTQAAWDRYEHGKRMPRANVVWRICKGFGVTPNYASGLLHHRSSDRICDFANPLAEMRKEMV